MRRLSLLVFAGLWFSSASAGGVKLGGNLPTDLWRPTQALAQRFTLRGQLQGIRWVHQTGRTVTRPAHLPLGATLSLDAPAGEWTDVVLIFDGPVSLTDGATERELSLRTLELPLDQPLATWGGAVTLHIDLSALERNDDQEALTSGAMAWVEPRD